MDNIMVKDQHYRTSRQMKLKLFTAIKCLSIFLMTGAIGLELWNLNAVITQAPVPPFLGPIFWIERFAVGVHLIEAVVAAIYAPRQQKSPLPYGIYTFFVGTIGLLELFDLAQITGLTRTEQRS
jgi:hypothetical protein